MEIILCFILLSLYYIYEVLLHNFILNLVLLKYIDIQRT
jgi:hypothetical protein